MLVSPSLYASKSSIHIPNHCNSDLIIETKCNNLDLNITQLKELI
jgi:hypothetical protein